MKNSRRGRFCVDERRPDYSFHASDAKAEGKVVKMAGLE